MGTTPRVTNTAPLVLGGVFLGAVSGGWLAALMGSSGSGYFPDLTGIPLGLVGATVGAAVGMFLGWLGGLVMGLLESQATGIVVAAVGVVLGSATLTVLLLLGHSREDAQEALLTAGVLGLFAAGLAWWSRHRSVPTRTST